VFQPRSNAHNPKEESLREPWLLLSVFCAEEAAMKTFMSLLFVVVVAAAEAQTTGQGQIRHVETSMNHLTVLEFGEPVTTLAIGDADSFQIERHEDKVFIKPLQLGVSTNLFVWTASRELSYELDPSGSLSSMDVLIRTDPAPNPRTVAPSEEELSERKLHAIATQVLTQTLEGAEDILQDSTKAEPNRVQATLEQIYSIGGQVYIRYSLTNLTETPYRVTTPVVYRQTPGKNAVSLTSLRNHQINQKTYASLKAGRGVALDLQAESAPHDLAPGEKVTGVIGIRSVDGLQPRLYQLNFGIDQNRPVTAEAVL
jgi:Conjugal transfer protein